MLVHVLKAAATRASAWASVKMGLSGSRVGEVLQRSIGPDQRIAFDSRIVAGAGDESGPSGAAGNGTAKQEHGKGQIYR